MSVTLLCSGRDYQRNTGTRQQTNKNQISNILVAYEKNNSKNDNTNKMKNNDTDNNDLFNKSIGTLFPVSEEKTRA